jgi:hypothetical protein
MPRNRRTCHHFVDFADDARVEGRVCSLLSDSRGSAGGGGACWEAEEAVFAERMDGMRWDCRDGPGEDPDEWKLGPEGSDKFPCKSLCMPGEVRWDDRG